MFIAALFTIAKICKQPKCRSTDKWIMKMWCVCIYIHIYLYIYMEKAMATHSSTLAGPYTESEKQLKSLLMKVKEENEKAGLNSTVKKLRSWHPVPSVYGI